MTRQQTRQPARPVLPQVDAVALRQSGAPIEFARRTRDVSTISVITLWACGRCGAAITAVEDQARHREWHQANDAVLALLRDYVVPAVLER